MFVLESAKQIAVLCYYYPSHECKLGKATIGLFSFRVIDSMMNPHVVKVQIK